MYAEERLRLIAEQARREGRVDVARLAEEFGVTTETIRRDLSTLERQSMVMRVHGGAIPTERLGFEPGVARRSGVMVAEKERIAKAAMAEVPDEGGILIDAGTTTAQLAQLMPTDRDLTVVTNCAPIAVTLAAKPRIKVLLVGGRVRGRTLAAVGDWTTRALSQIYIDVAFVGTNGFSTQRGLTTPDPAEAAAKRAMIEAARRTVVLADHTKFGADALMRFADLRDVDVLITDTGLDADLIADIQGAGPRVIRA
ncbi:MAG TPA: DeoR/GlpR family DNA-binding transcription regulator [Euzebyales bacterium]|nr:DeoR/GlpR family DNA-binding transcription regulator [Euzebyales bacterium]